MPRVLVTGASGYLGSRLCQFLAADGQQVRAAVRKPVPWLDEVEQVTADHLGTVAELADAYRGCDAVVHLASPNEVVTAEQPDQALCDTVAATRHAATAAADAGVGRFVYVSTIHVYGVPSPGDRFRETDVPAPRSTYAIARLTSEHVAAAVCAARGMELVVFRLSNSVGPPADPRVQRWTLLANDLCRQAVTTGELHLRSHGFDWRDFIAMDDACHALSLATASGGGLAGTYNLGRGEPMTVRELAGVVQDCVEAATGCRPPLHAPPPPPAAPGKYTVDTTRLLSTGWRPTRTVRSAIEATVRFCLERKADL